MRRPPYQREDRGRLDVKMTPMIDVVFQLLIFFVCTVSFQALEESLPANLKVQGTGTAPLEPELAELEEVVILLVVRDGRTSWVMNDRPYESLAELRSTLRRLASVRTDLPVILDIQPAIAMGDVVTVYDVCRLAGFRKIQFAAKAQA